MQCYREIMDELEILYLTSGKAKWLDGQTSKIHFLWSEFDNILLLGWAASKFYLVTGAFVITIKIILWENSFEKNIIVWCRDYAN